MASSVSIDDSVDYAALSHAERIDALVELQRRRSCLDAQEQRLLAVIEADPTPELERRAVVVDKHYVREEVACALRVSFVTAARRLQLASVLVHRLPATLDALAEGRVGYLHTRVAVEAVKDLPAELVPAFEARVLPRCGQQTVGEFARTVTRAVLALDLAPAQERHQRAAADRRVALFPGEDGMATLWALLSAPDAQAVMTALDTAAHQDSERCTNNRTDDRSMDQRRADILVDLVTGTSDDPSDQRAGRRRGLRPAVQVTVALSTLLGADQQPGELAGHGPIPACLAVAIAFDPTATWRRLVTDHLGHLLDHGTTTYRPPARLADHVSARDQTCRLPGCTRTAYTCELDHVIAFARGGPTNANNLHTLCGRHHHLKHDGNWRAHRTGDGTTVWITPTGHTYRKPPASYPIDRTTDPPDQAAV